jgi:antitoxin component of RelBE/YafQ-DinJ toxin-antitoxin module
MVYLRIKENTPQAKLMLEYLKMMPYVEVIEKADIPNATTVKAIQEARTGKVTKAKDMNDLIKQLNS